MKTLSLQPSLAEQVHDAIVAEIAAGRIPAGGRVIQEQLAAELGVSRQPVQSALLLLRKQGVLRDAPGRGLEVAPLDPQHAAHRYEVRAVLEGLAARLAARAADERAAKQGAALIDAGRKAVASGSLARMIAADMRFHEFVYELSGNPLIAPALAVHWTHTQRAMGEVLARDEAPRDVWDQHQRLLQAIVDGDAEAAEKRARQHIAQAAQFVLTRLRREAQAAGPAAPARAGRR